MPLESNPDLLPIEWSNEVIQNMAQTSAVMGLSRRRTLSTRTQRLPATALLADAYWVGGTDSTGLKQETDADWKGVNLIVEELAALVAIPDAYAADSGFPVWDETRPQVVEALGKALDAAVLFGVDKPVTWTSPAIVPGAVAVGNVVAEGTNPDFAVDVAQAAEELAETGYDTTGFASRPGLQWKLVGLRSQDGAPIYQQNLSGPISTGLYGFPLMPVKNGSWDSDDAELVLGDWSKSIVGIRQDITFTRHTDGVITDSGGAVTFNAMQQDATIWRAVMRVAWAAAVPATRLAPNPGQDDGKFPFSVVTPGS
jgi:HK97 family phage major capsid protein